MAVSESTAASVAEFRTRIQHCCGRFLAELKDGVLHVACVRCKDLVPIQLDQPSQESRVKTMH